ncbi:SDR family oxidoreductase [Maribacter halichondriae]|uniref:SDR family oxidoreductase n=1 Tax=Maribacter halichondriae TaxID=2980554 RepID=UPI00235A03BB|nr:SDR family oxidoreductase [Maribacter sp. Hal144]
MERKVVLITGGSSGIGKAIGMYLSSQGFSVYGTTRNLEKHAHFESFELLFLDVGNVISIQEAVDTIIAKEGRLDVLINNAGVGITGPIEETPHEEILKCLDTNFHGPLHMIKAVLPQMREQKSGLIINITSIASYMGLPFRGIYSASKGALALATEAMRMEIKTFGIEMTTLGPGDFATNIASGRYHAPVNQNSPYGAAYAQTLKMINDDVYRAGDPVSVAQKVLSIIKTDQPKVHYRVGAFMQKFSLLLKKILPDKVYEKLLLNHYKL